MYPFISIFGFEVQTYSVIAVIGFIVTAMVAAGLGKTRKVSADKSITATLMSAIGIFIGGHILFALTNIKSIVKAIMTDGFKFSDLLPYISGMVFYGGLFGAIIALHIYSNVNKSVSKKDLFDVFSVSVPLFHCFGRIGCFFAGCCYGVESDFGIISYFNTSATHYGVSRFPVALVEAFGNLLIFFLLLYFFKKIKFAGKLVFVYLLMYAPLRFVLEFFRGDEVRGFIFGLSTSQFISVLIVCFLIIYFAVSINRRGSKAK